MNLNLSAILERVRAATAAAAVSDPVSAVSAAYREPDTANPLICNGVSAVSGVSAETVKVEGGTDESGPGEDRQGEGSDSPPGPEGSRESLYLSDTSDTSDTARQGAGFRVSGAYRVADTSDTEQALTPADPAPRYRAWRIIRPDGSSGGIVMDPAGMTEAEALDAVDRWPGCTVEPLERSRLD